MNIQGLQKLSLLDFPGKMSCTVFTGGCNLRCPFCHNASLVLEPSQEPYLTQEAFFAFLRKRKGLLDGVCVSGGEPLLQPDIRPFLEGVRELGYLIKLDTNGAFPDRLRELAGAGLLDYVAMDVKNSLEHYGKTVGAAHFDTAPVEASAAFLLEGSVPYEFRTTVVRQLHTKEDFISIGKWLKGAAHYYLQAFEDSGDLIAQGLSGYGKEELADFLRLIRREIPSAEVRGIELNI